MQPTASQSKLRSPSDQPGLLLEVQVEIIMHSEIMHSVRKAKEESGKRKSEERGKEALVK